VEDALQRGYAASASQSLRIWHDKRFPVYSADETRVLDVDGSGVDVIGAISFLIKRNKRKGVSDHDPAEGQGDCLSAEEYPSTKSEHLGRA